MISEVGVVKVEHELEEAMHLVLLHDSCLAHRAQELVELGPPLRLELLDRHVRHIDDHDVVAQTCLVEADLCHVELGARLLNLRRRHLLLLL